MRALSLRVTTGLALLPLGCCACAAMVITPFPREPPSTLLPRVATRLTAQPLRERSIGMLSPLLCAARRLLVYGQPSLVFLLYRPSLQGERREIVCYPSAACPTCAVVIVGSSGIL